MKFSVIYPVDHDGVRYEAGSTLDLDPYDAQQLMDAGRIAASDEAEQLDDEIESAFPTEAEVTAFTKASAAEYALEHFKVELKGNAGEVKDQVRGLIASAKAQLYEAKAAPKAEE